MIARCNNVNLLLRKKVLTWPLIWLKGKIQPVANYAEHFQFTKLFHMSINILHNFVHRISDFCIRYLHKTLENWLEIVDMCISRPGYQFHKEILCLPISRHWWTLNHIFFLIILVENKPSSVKTMINTNCKFQQQCQENVVTTQLRVDKAKKSLDIILNWVLIILPFPTPYPAAYQPTLNFCATLYGIHVHKDLDFNRWANPKHPIKELHTYHVSWHPVNLPLDL